MPDTRIIAHLVDNVCLVIRGQYVPEGAVRRTLEVLEEDGTKLADVVFNGYKEKKRLIGQNYSYGHYRRSGYGYRYGYGSYGSYGSYGTEEEDETPKKRRRVGNRKRKRQRQSQTSGNPEGTRDGSPAAK